MGIRHIIFRSAGHNNINLKTAKGLGFKVANAPEYSPYAIAVHAMALLLAQNRKLVLANTQLQAYIFLKDDLLGFNLHGKTFGIIGTGRIGQIMSKIVHGFGCKIVANDLEPDNDPIERYDVAYTSLDEECKQSDIISQHIPLS